MFTPVTKYSCVRGTVAMTVPILPLSLPLVTTTRSPLTMGKYFLSSTTSGYWSARPFFSFCMLRRAWIFVGISGFWTCGGWTTPYLPVSTLMERFGRSEPSFQSSAALRRALRLTSVTFSCSHFWRCIQTCLASNCSFINSLRLSRFFSCHTMAPLTWRISFAFFAWRTALRPGRAINWVMVDVMDAAVGAVVVVVVVVRCADYRAIDGRAGEKNRVVRRQWTRRGAAAFGRVWSAPCRRWKPRLPADAMHRGNLAAD